jgi:hypothetical protein
MLCIVFSNAGDDFVEGRFMLIKKILLRIGLVGKGLINNGFRTNGTATMRVDIYMNLPALETV